MSNFNEWKIVIARKPHKCEFCEKQIQSGEKYSYESGLYDGDFFTRKLCPECYDMMISFCKETGDEEFCWDWITEWLQEIYCYECPSKEDCKSSPQQCDIIRGNFAGTFPQENEE